MIASCLGLSILAIIALFIGSAAGISAQQGAWPVVAILPLIGLPIGMLLIIAYIIVSGIRRSRTARDA